MHTSYQFISPLNCFSDEEKRLQRNLGLLGSVALVMPRLRNLIVHRLLRLPPNRFFTFLYFLVKQYAFRRKIYVTKTSLWNSVRIFLRSVLRQDIFRHTPDRA